MNSILRRLVFISAFVAAPHFAGAAANDVIITQRNAGNTAFAQRTVTVTANGYLKFDSNSLPTVETLDSTYLPLAGGTMTGNIVFGDTGEGLTLHGSGTIRGASGSLTFTASGTNQNINLTPSGTGGIVSSLARGLATTSTDGLALVNTTDAAAGAQQISPRLLVQGNGWKTDATAASQTVAAFFEVLPVQGAAAPSALIRFGSIINGAAATFPMTLTSAGVLTITSSLSATGGTVSGNIVSAGAFFQESVDTRSGAGAISAATGATKLTTTGADALTLADGLNGQLKRIVMIADGGDGTLTPTTKTGYSTITFNDVGDSVTLQFYTTQGWMILSNYGATVAP